jgi:hypothetical protein
MGSVMIGCDIGQRVDPTSIAVTELKILPGGKERYQVRFVERLPLQTKYPQVAARITAVVAKLRARDPWLFLDATGVGLPVVDLVRAALEAEGIDCKMTACFFTHGDRLEWVNFKREARVGKAFLVSRLQALLQQGAIQWPRTPETEYLATELLNYEIRVDENANDRYGAFKVGSHDDVVTAVGLSVLSDAGRVAVAISSTEEEREERKNIEAARKLQEIAQRVLDGEPPLSEEPPAPEPVPRPEDTSTSLRALINLGTLGRWW